MLFYPGQLILPSKKSWKIVSDKKLTFDSSFSTLAFKKLLVSWRLTRLLVLAWSRQAGDVLAISVRTICLCPFVEAGICFHNFLEARLNVEESHALTVKADYINSERITEVQNKEKEAGLNAYKVFLPSLSFTSTEKQRLTSTICKYIGCTNTTYSMHRALP